jgi:hypothetical protein
MFILQKLTSKQTNGTGTRGRALCVRIVFPVVQVLFLYAVQFLLDKYVKPLTSFVFALHVTVTFSLLFVYFQQFCFTNRPAGSELQSALFICAAYISSEFCSVTVLLLLNTEKVPYRILHTFILPHSTKFHVSGRWDFPFYTRICRTAPYIGGKVARA